MTLRIEQGWDFRRIGQAKLKVTEATGSLVFHVICKSDGVWRGDSTGAVTGTVVDADTQYCHTDISAAMDGGDYSDFAGALASALIAGSLAHGNSWTYTVSWSAANRQYTIAAGGVNTFSLVFSGGTFTVTNPDGIADGRWMRRLIGFYQDDATAASHVSNIRPFFVIVGATGAKSRVIEDAAVQSVIGGIADGAATYAVGPTTPTFTHDFACEFEAKAAVYKRSAATDSTNGAVPFTYQHLVQYAGGWEPIYVDDGSEYTVHKLRADGAADFRAERAAPDWDGYFHVPFGTYVVARLTAGGVLVPGG